MPIADLFAAIRWWAILLFIGAAATPLTLTLFERLPDRGYAFVKMVGVLIISYLFWLLGSFNLLGNNVGGILFASLSLVGLSAWTTIRNPGEATRWLRKNMWQVVMTELLFALIFALWVWVRSQNPAIAATEKPMEFAFLNAIGRSPSFPPLDPWLSGFAISYYYFGYVMTSVIARLALVPEPIAFNLGIAWLVAGTAITAFGLVYNLCAVGNLRRSARVLGLIASIALPIAGNLEIGLEVLHANGVGSAEFWQWLDVRDLNGPAVLDDSPRYESSSWWWWRSSRVIHEYHLSGRAEDGLEPIAEFPGFSFVLGDMHPHVLALPFAFLSLAVAYSWWLIGSVGNRSLTTETWDKADWTGRFRGLIDIIDLPMWAFTAVILGGLSFLNTWDVLIHLFVVLGSFLLSQWKRQGWHSRILSQTLTVAILLVIPAILLYLPFYIGFRSQAGAPYLLPMLMRPTRLAHFLIIFGMPLWSILFLVVTLAIRQRFRRWKAGLMAVAFINVILILLMLFLGWIIASTPEGAWRVTTLATDLDINLPPRPEGAVALGWGVSAVFHLIPSILGAKLALPGVLLLLSGLLALVVMVWIDRFSVNRNEIYESEDDRTFSPQDSEVAHPANSSPDALPFVLLLIATGVLLTLGPEFVYLRDNFGMRLNTIFKFYYQAWVMFGIAALYALSNLWHSLSIRQPRIIPQLATAGYTLALLISLLFPYYAIQSRTAEYRGAPSAETRQPATLDGMAQIKRFNPDEYDAIVWLRENIAATPVILEAVGGQYTGFARISANTGLPTMLGWAGHEFQWRGNSTPEPGLRDPLVREIYSQTDWDKTAELLDQYKVAYIYVGELELSTYGPQISDKYDERLNVVYRNNSVTIYQWQPE